MTHMTWNNFVNQVSPINSFEQHVQRPPIWEVEPYHHMLGDEINFSCGDQNDGYLVFTSLKFWQE